MKGISILDIGSGYGCLGFTAAHDETVMVNDYTIIEPDPVMRHIVKESWFRSRMNANLHLHDNLVPVRGRYDIIVLSHVVEHVSDPLSLVTAAASLLAEGGILFIDVPNQDHLFKTEVFPHMLFFSMGSLAVLLKKASLEVLTLDTWGLPMGISPLNARQSFFRRLIGYALAKVRPIIHGRLLVALYGRYYGACRQDPNGTWIRGVCRKSGTAVVC